MERRSASCCVPQFGPATYTIETVLRRSRESLQYPLSAPRLSSSSVGSRVLAPSTKQTTQASLPPPPPPLGYLGKPRTDAALCFSPKQPLFHPPPVELPCYHAVIHDQKAHHQCMLSRHRHESRKVYFFHMCHCVRAVGANDNRPFSGTRWAFPPVRLEICCRGCREASHSYRTHRS